MNDRELLTKVAKVLGWRVTAYSEFRSTGVVNGGTMMVVADGRAFGWNPLHNDGDALRLAVTLAIPLDYDITVPLTNDPMVVIRRAIVEAAATDREAA